MDALSAGAMRHDAIQYRQVYHINIPQGATIDDLMRPAFWVHQGSRVTPGDLIDCVAVDGSYDVTLRVVAVSAKKTDVTMRLLRAWEAPAVAKKLPEAAPLAVDFAETYRWRVTRKKDGVELKRDMASEAEATAWAFDTMKAAA